jgi:hypothetical protein
MAGVLDFQQYIGGPDQIKAEQVFPSDQKTLIYTFSVPVTGWTFSADYQTIVVDTVTFNRYTGAPNFSGSKVTGTFDLVDITGANAPTIIDAAQGVVKVVFPAGMYTGPIIPDARKNVPITVFALTWADDSTPSQINTHRWALIQCWEPDVVAGDPTLAAGYTALVTGA